MFCLLVVLAKLSLLGKWLARKTPLRKPNCGEGIVSRKPRPKSAYDFLGLLYCFIVLLCVSVVSWPYMIYFPTAMARYSLFVLKVPLNTKQTNKHLTLLFGWQQGHLTCKKLGVGSLVVMCDPKAIPVVNGEQSNPQNCTHILSWLATFASFGQMARTCIGDRTGITDFALWAPLTWLGVINPAEIFLLYVELYLATLVSAMLDGVGIHSGCNLMTVNTWHAVNCILCVHPWL